MKCTTSLEDILTKLVLKEIDTPNIPTFGKFIEFVVKTLLTRKLQAMIVLLVNIFRYLRKK